MPVIDGKYYVPDDTSWWDDLIGGSSQKLCQHVRARLALLVGPRTNAFSLREERYDRLSTEPYFCTKMFFADSIQADCI